MRTADLSEPRRTGWHRCGDSSPRGQELTRIGGRTAQLERANQRLAQLAEKDGLTGLGNRRHFDQELSRSWREHCRRGASARQTRDRRDRD